MKQPKLVHLVTSPLTAQAFLVGQLGYMREQGFHVTLVSSPGPELNRIRECERIDTIGLPICRQPSPAHDLMSLQRLTSLLRELRPDIVHSGTPKASFLGGIAACLARVPVRLMTLHGMRSDGLRGMPRRIILAMERQSCRTAGRVYCVSESLRRRALELKLAAPEKLKVLVRGTANGIDAARFSRSPEVLAEAETLRQSLSIPAESTVVGYVGRLVRDKGIAELILAFRRLKQEFIGLRLLLVGPFEEYDRLSREIRAEIADDPQIIQTGFLNDPRPAYAIMTVLALPSHREGFPYVPMEAAAMELPVVATEVTGCTDAVSAGQTGMLIPARDPAALATALRTYLLSAELRYAHGKAGRLRVSREFAPRAIWEAVFQEYLEMLQRRRQPLPAQADCSAFRPGILNLALEEGRNE